MFLHLLGGDDNGFAQVFVAVKADVLHDLFDDRVKTSFEGLCVSCKKIKVNGRMNEGVKE